MRKPLIYITILVLGALACNKDTVETTPSIKLKSLSTEVVPVNGTLVVRLDYTDKEGDITDTIFFKKIRLNIRSVTTLRDSLALPMPDDVGNVQSKGEIELDLDYQNHLISAIDPGTPAENDTLLLLFALKDKANHISDTVTAGPVVILR